MLKQLEEILLSNSNGTGADSGGFSFYMVKRRKFLNFLVFPRQGAEPGYFIKTVRFKRDNSLIEREFTGAKKFNDLLKGNEILHTPYPFDLVCVDSRKVFFTKYITYRELSKGLLDFPDTLKRITKIINLLGESSIERLDNNGMEAVGGELESGLLQLKIGYGGADEILAALDLKSLVKEIGRVVMVHLDMGLNNVLVTKEGKYYVCDWEFYQDRGLPLYDILYFIVHFFGCYHQGHCSDFATSSDTFGVITYCFCDKNETSDMVVGTISAYCEKFGIDITLYPRVLLYILMRVENLVIEGRWAQKKGYFGSMAKAVLMNINKFRFE